MGGTECCRARRHLTRTEVLFDSTPIRLSDPVAAFRIVRQAHQQFRKPLVIMRRREVGHTAGSDRFSYSGDIRSDNGQSSGHAFQDAIGAAFHRRREHAGVHGLQQPGNIVYVAEKPDARPEPQRVCEVPDGFIRITGAPGQQQERRAIACRDGEHGLAPGAKQRRVILVSRQVRHHTRKKRAFVHPKLFTPLRAGEARPAELDAISDHMHLRCGKTVRCLQVCGAVLRIRHEHRCPAGCPPIHPPRYRIDGARTVIPDTQTRARRSPQRTAESVRQTPRRKEDVGPRASERPSEPDQRAHLLNPRSGRRKTQTIPLESRFIAQAADRSLRPKRKHADLGVFLVTEIARKQQRLSFGASHLEARENEDNSNPTETRHTRRMHDRRRVVETLRAAGRLGSRHG